MKQDFNPKINTTAADISFTAIQFLVLMLFIVLPNYYTFEFPKIIIWLGFLLAFIGFILFLIAVFTLRKSLSLYPTPSPNSKLITHGIYKYVRHPIYLSLLIFLFGLSIFFAGIPKFILFIIAVILFSKKADYEEERLAEKFKNYKNYKAKTGKFIPRL